jgi:AraC family transcriptional regulator of arabinose operon
MSDRGITPLPDTVTLVTGHFKEVTGYHSWRPKGSRDWLIILSMSGHGRFGHAKGEFVAAPNDVVLIRPGTPHDYGVAHGHPKWELVWAHFYPKPEWIEWLDWPEEAPGLMRLSLYDPTLARLVIARFTDAHRLATGPLKRRDSLAMNALEEMLLWCDVINPKGEQAELDDRIRAATDWLCRNIEKKITLELLADAVGMSVSRLAHLFRDQIGMPPLQFLELQRMRRAKQLLEVTPLSVKQIAAEVGFDNPFYFTLRFKKATSVSPTEYRKRLGVDDAEGADEPEPTEAELAAAAGDTE